jgi:hypothetical protein
MKRAEAGSLLWRIQTTSGGENRDAPFILMARSGVYWFYSFLNNVLTTVSQISNTGTKFLWSRRFLLMMMEM